jgi:hypothetical protein
MIVDHRTYTLRPGTLKDYLSIYETKGYPVQTRHLGQPLGWFTSMDIGELNQIVHLWAYADHADRAARRSALAADPLWAPFLAEAMPLVQTMTNKILVKPPFITTR